MLREKITRNYTTAAAAAAAAATTTTNNNNPLFNEGGIPVASIQ